MTDDASNLKPAKPVTPRRKSGASGAAKAPDAPRPDVQPVPQPQSPTPSSSHQLALDEKAIELQAQTAAEAEEQAHEAAADAAEDAEDVARESSQGAPLEVVNAVPSPASAAAGPTDAPEFDFPKTIRETLQAVDEAWGAFRAMAERFPGERIDERLSEYGWTRKQMLAHVAAWHDLTADRIVKMLNTGEAVPLEQDTDAFNASIARRAVGKTSGEILKDMDATFNRLRRQLARASDAQLAADDWWLAYVIGGNTYGHYEEHWSDVRTPDPPPNTRQRR